MVLQLKEHNVSNKRSISARRHCRSARRRSRLLRWSCAPSWRDCSRRRPPRRPLRDRARRTPVPSHDPITLPHARRRALPRRSPRSGSRSYGGCKPPRRTGRCRGTVRVTAAASLAPILLQALATLLKRHPALRVELALDDHFADLGGGRWDLAVRIAPRIADASLLARRLSPLPLFTLAAPTYLAKQGAPQSPDELAQHRLIGLRLPATGRMMPWLFRAPGGTRRLQPDFALVVDGSDALRTATTFGMGIAQAGAESTAALLASGGLVTIRCLRATALGSVDAPRPGARWIGAHPSHGCVRGSVSAEGK